MDEQKDPQDGFSFLQETIKEDKIIAKKMRKYFYMVIVLGIVFGIVSSASFVVVKPWLESFLEEEEIVIIPQDDEYVLPDEVKEEVKAEIKDEIKEEAEAEVEEDVSEELSFENVYQQLYEISRTAARSIVTIQSIILPSEEEEEATGELSVEPTSVTGLIVAQTELEVLVLAPTGWLIEGEEISVTFSSGNIYSTKIKMEDENLGYAIFSIAKSDTILEDIEVAELGNSNTVAQGDVVIALGNYLQYDDGIGYGVVSSTSNSLNYIDGIYELIATDIPIEVDGTGVLINTSGQVIGLINEDMTTSSAVQAIGISRLKALIELMSNGNSIPYLGITCVVVTQEIADSNLGMPVGLYIQSVEANSPAIAAGLKVGDIITSINGQVVYSSTSFQNRLLSGTKGDTISLQVQRIGQEGYVEVEILATLDSYDS